MKKTEEFKWLDSLNVTTCRYAFIDLSAAYHNFIIGICNCPKYKSKKYDTIRIAVRGDDITFNKSNKRYAHIPVLSSNRFDYIDCGNHNIPIGDNIKYDNVRIKFDGIDFWLSLSISLRKPIIFERKDILSNPVGIDVGIRTSATLSNGITFGNPDGYRLSILDNRRRKMQAAVDRDIQKRLKESSRTRTKYEDIPKSKNQLKREEKLRKTKIKISNFYKNYYHNISRKIANMNYSMIVIEDLKVQGMYEDSYGKKRFNVYESRMATLLEYISYKCQDNGALIIKAPRNFKSSQICSNCKNEYKIGASKTYKCPYCGIILDRDLNAAINLMDYGVSLELNQDWVR